jgi:hypothetical protein
MIKQVSWLLGEAVLWDEEYMRMEEGSADSALQLCVLLMVDVREVQGRTGVKSVL